MVSISAEPIFSSFSMTYTSSCLLWEWDYAA